MKFQGFVGPAYTLPSVNVDCQRCVNLYPELIESGTGKEAQVAYLKSTPGLRKQFTVGTGPIRMILVDEPAVRTDEPLNRVFVVSGNKLYKCTYNSGTNSWATTQIQDFDTSLPAVLLTSTGPVRGLTYDASATNDVMMRGVFVDGSAVYSYLKRHHSGDPLEEGIFVDDPGFIAAPNPTNVIRIDDHYIYAQADSNQFWVSQAGQIGVTALDFASAEGDPDKIVAIISNHRELWLINERSTEVWSNTGGADFPFERVAGGFSEKGCAAAGSVAKIEGLIFWLGREMNGQGVVYAASGLTPERISTHAIESAIATYADLTTATGYTYQSGGHSFYVLNFAEATWVFDLSTKLWHERAFTNSDGDLERHRGECHAFFPNFGMHLVGDYQNGNVYSFDDNYYKDDTSPITRLRTTPHVSNALKRLFFKSLQLDMETGVGLDGAVQGSDPQVMMDYSNDGGHTWSDEAWASAGKKIGGIGNFKARVIWRRLGSAFDRVFRIKITDPVPVTLLSVELDVEGGQ